MPTQMIVRIEPDVKERFDMLVRSEGKNTSRVVRELIDDYIRTRDMSLYVNDLWERIEGELRGQKVTPKDIDQTIREVRKLKKR